jgi:hypothetical protein
MKREALKKKYADWHWGMEPTIEVNWDDKDLPEYLVECGRLIELHVRPIEGNPKRKDKVIKFKKSDANASHVAFDPQHKSQRLYLLLNDGARKKMKKLWDSSEYDDHTPFEIAKYVGGRHAKKNDYPKRVKVRPLGILTNVVYATEKKGDGYSYYIHKMGEESGIQPAVGIDKKGRAWVLGGNYTSPVPGITD